MIARSDECDGNVNIRRLPSIMVQIAPVSIRTAENSRIQDLLACPGEAGFRFDSGPDNCGLG